MNILFLSEVDCFPPNAGEKLRCFNLIRSMQEFSDQLHLIIGNPPVDNGSYPKVRYYHFPSGYYSKNRWANLTNLFRQDRDLVKLLKAILDNEQIDIAFIDYNFLGNYINLFKKRNIRVIYGTHNVQSYLNQQLPARNLKDLSYKKIRFSMERLHEDHFFRKANALICVSQKDKEFYEQTFNELPVFVIPNYINEKQYHFNKPPAKKNQIIMAANFSAFQNRFGLRWFMENVWDQELANKTSFLIAGHNSDRELTELNQQGINSQNTIALGAVDDMKLLIAQSRAAIIPLLHGSGTRLKCIEAMALKTNIVSTTVGAEGIDHRGSFLIADDPWHFKQSLLQILNNKVHNEDLAYSIFLEKYSSKANTLLLKKILSASLIGNL